MGEKYNLGGSEERTNLEIVDTVCAHLEGLFPAAQNPALKEKGIDSYAALKTFVEDRPGHDRRYAIDASKIQRELGWAASHDLDAGIGDTVKWYLENREWCATVSGEYRRQRLGVDAQSAPAEPA